MPKVTLEFTLPQEEPEYRVAVEAQALATVLHDHLLDLRSIIKYNALLINERDSKTAQIKLAAKLRANLYEALIVEGITSIE